MSQIDKNLSDILNTEYSIVEDTDAEYTNLPIELTDDSADQIKSDADYARTNLYRLIEQGNDALTGILEVAKHSQHPRAYEVASNMIKNLSEVAEKLMVIQKQQQDLARNSNSGQQGTLNIDKAVVFTGSTSELLKQIKSETEKLT